MGTKKDFIRLLNQRGSTVRYHREDSTTLCSCVTPEGFRDPEWHDAHPSAPVCDERGFLPSGGSTVDLDFKGFVQPSQSTRATRLSPEYIASMFGEIQEGDHIGLFPEAWKGTPLEFYNWSQSGEDYIRYNGRTYMAVAANLIADPATGNPRGHWEVGLRLVTEALNS